MKQDLLKELTLNPIRLPGVMGPLLIYQLADSHHWDVCCIIFDIMTVIILLKKLSMQFYKMYHYIKIDDFR